MTIIKLVFCAITACVTAVMLKSKKAELSVCIVIAVAILLFGFVMQYFEKLLSAFEIIKSYLYVGEGYFGILMKAVLVTFLCEFGSDVCKDAGYQGVSGQIELAGRLYIMVLGIPILLAVIECIEAF